MKKRNVRIYDERSNTAVVFEIIVVMFMFSLAFGIMLIE